MKRFDVIISPSAEADIAESYVWGLAEWGEEQSAAWVQKLRRAINKLETFPLRCPIAPESAELGVEVRQLIVGRYRVLFVVIEQTVLVSHVRGAFVENNRLDAGVNE